MSVDEEGPELDALCFHSSVCFDDAEAVDPEDIKDLPDVDDNGDVVVDGNDDPEENLDVPMDWRYWMVTKPNTLPVTTLNTTSTISHT